MAQALVGLTLNNPLNAVGADETKDSQIWNGVAALTAGGTYATGGLPVPWTSAKNAGGASVLIQSRQTAPYLATFQSAAGTGLIYQYNLATGKLQIFAAGVEVANGTVVTVDTIAFQAWFQKG